MDQLAALYQQFDPLRPLEVTEQDLYVDYEEEAGLYQQTLPLYRQIGDRLV